MTSTIAHYRITAKLGEGGMGEVFRATDTKLSRDVAIKVLPDTFANDPDRLARFTREAQVLASLNHPNIAAIYGVEERALILELVEGPTLADRIAQGPIPLDEALPLIEQLIAALEYAHEKGVVHRDFKPANIKITPEGRVKVLDFGLAKALTADTAAPDPASSPTITMRATMVGMIMGTAAYMAPEQARGQKVDKRADIWAFGAVVYEMLTARQLFGGDTVSDIIAQVLTKPLDLDPVPARVRPLLRRCLERDPRKRLRDIGDASLDAVETAAPAAVPLPKRSALPWIVAAVSTLAACVVAFFWLRAAPPPVLPYRFTVDNTSLIAFSPNGRWMLSGTNGLKVRPLDGVSWRSLPATEGASNPFWSADSSAIGYFSEGRLRAIPVEGGAVRNLAAAPAAQGGSWRGGAADGTILFAAAGRLHTVDVRSGKIQDLPLRLSESQKPILPAFLPEGDGFVYLLESGDTGTLFRSSLASTTAEPLVNTSRRVAFARHPRTGKWYIFFTRLDPSAGVGRLTLMTAPIHPRTGTLTAEPVKLMDAMSNLPGTRYDFFDVAAGGLIYWRNTTPSLSIWRLHWFDRNGNVTGSVGDAGGFSSIALSRDESKVAALQGYPIQHNWIYNLQNGTSARVSAQPANEGNPVWSPDGRVLYYISENEAGDRVMGLPAAPGALPEVIYHAREPHMLSLQDITPDGRYLVFVGRRTNPLSGVLRMDLTAPAESRTPEPVIPGSAEMGSIAHARISPDGRSLILRAGGLLYACRYPPAGDPPHQVADYQPTAWPFFSRDGRLLYVVSHQAVYSHTVLPLPGGGLRLGGRSLLFKLISPARADANIGAASRDGNRIMVLSTDDVEESRIQFLTDWTTLLGH